MSTQTPISTPELLARLRRHYMKPGDMPGGIFLEECGRNGGTGGRVDALHVGFTSSSGRILTGHELKVSRSDWLHELSKPTKADAWADNCHAWYLVTATADIVHPGELPAGWGHMVPGTSKTRMKVLAPATIHHDRVPSWDTTRSMFARLDTIQRVEHQEYRRTLTARLRSEIRTELEGHTKAADQRELDQAKRLLQQIEDAIGRPIETYTRDDDKVTPHDLGRALALLRARDEAFGRYNASVGPHLIGELRAIADNLAALVKVDQATAPSSR